MDERGDGLVLTVLALRSEHIFYVKMLRGGRGAEQLSPEEEQAGRPGPGGLSPAGRAAGPPCLPWAS